MKCFHHVDADGFCSAYWVHKRYPIMKTEDFIPINYDMNIDWFNMFEKDECVIIVDFSFEPEDMRKLLNKTKNVIWIDHHISAINKYKDFEFYIKGLRHDGVAGCMLTWAYFNKLNDGRHPFSSNMCIEAPWMTKYIADYDVWKYEFGDETRHFKLGLDAEGLKHPCDKVWDEMLEIDKVRELINNGTICKKYRDSLGETACNAIGFEYELEGHICFCLNNAGPITNSEWFGDRIKKYDMVCEFSYNGKEKTWSYSLYSKKIDTSIISQKFGGGGHKGASGFHSKEFIFK